MRKIFPNATKKDVRFAMTELLKIEVKYSSFSVFFQRPVPHEDERTLDVNEYIFPLRLLKEFMLYHGKSKYSINHRPESCQWSANFDINAAIKSANFDINAAIKSTIQNLEE